MDKKIQDLKVILDRLRGWTVLYGEEYATVDILTHEDRSVVGLAYTDECIDAKPCIRKEYLERKEKEPGEGNRTGSGN